MKQATPQDWCRAENTCPKAAAPALQCSPLQKIGNKLFLAAALTLVLSQLSANAASGSWNVDASGNWSNPANWTSHVVPGTNAADVISLTNSISAPATVTLDVPGATNGTLNIGSTTAFPYTLKSINGLGLTFFNSNATAYILQLASSSTDVISAPLYLADSVSVTNNSTLVLSGVVSGATGKGITKSGSGPLLLPAANTFDGSFVLKGGKTYLDGVINTANSSDTVGTGGSEAPMLIIQGTGSFLSTGDLTIAAAGNSTAAVNISSTNVNGALSVGTLAVSWADAANGALNQTNGIVKVGTLLVGGRDSASASAVGHYNLMGGSLTTTGDFEMGVYGIGVLNVLGGTVDIGGQASFGQQTGSAGYMNMSGGTLNQNNPANRLLVGEGGKGTLSVGGTGVVNVRGTELTIGGIAGATVTNTVNILPGGTINTPAIRSTSGKGVITLYGGGVLRATASSTSYMCNLLQANLSPASGPIAFIDSSTNSITILQSLLGTGGLTKLGIGCLVLAGTNTFTNTTTVSAGRLLGGSGGSSVSLVNVATGATNGAQVNALDGQYKCASVTLSNASGLEFNFNVNPSLTTVPLLINGNLTVAGTLNVLVSGDVRFVGGTVLPLLQYTGTLSGTLPTSVALPPNITGGLVYNSSTKTLSLRVDSAPIYMTSGSGQYRLAWGAGSLLQATNVNGPWTTNTSAVSPYTNTPNPNVPTLFYRVRLQ